MVAVLEVPGVNSCGNTNMWHIRVTSRAEHENFRAAQFFSAQDVSSPPPGRNNSEWMKPSGNKNRLRVVKLGLNGGTVLFFNWALEYIAHLYSGLYSDMYSDMTSQSIKASNGVTESCPSWGMTLEHARTVYTPCVYFTLNRSFYPSTSSTPSVRADSSSYRDTSSVVTKLGHSSQLYTLCYTRQTAVAQCYAVVPYTLWTERELRTYCFVIHRR